MAEFKPKCGSSGIGSIPHKHYKKVVKNILEKFDFPYWPQIVKKGFIENMYVQYSEGMPCLEIDLENEKIHFNTNNDAGLYEWYEKVVNKDVDHFKMTSKRASGFHELIKKAGKKEYLKGQTTGPISFGLSVVDQDKKPILYNSQFLEVIVNSLAMKAAWQIRRLKEVSDNVIMF
ncbi:hypothetical protein FJZ53_06695, partial [Candidatus Woesearchaeota archaeon]|nr:hypothetical protein [Candidatus Woesearchaeota archaeon]